MPALFQRRRGSGLVMALILSVVLLSLVGTYLHLTSSELRQSEAGYIYTTLLNLAEAGAEDALWSLHRQEWTDWRQDSAQRYRELDPIDLGAGRSGTARIFLDTRDRDPVLWVESQTTYPDGQKYTRQVRLDLTPRRPFGTGLVAVRRLDFKGNRVLVDSYDSARGPYNPVINRGDQVVVACLAAEEEAAAVLNGDIFGYLATGGGQPLFLEQGRVYGEDTLYGVWVDWSRISRNFAGDYPDPALPTLVEAKASLPGAVGKTITIGDPSGLTTQFYDLPNLNLKAKETLVVQGKVTMVLREDTKMMGEVRLAEEGELALYVLGDFETSGEGLVNPSQVPARLRLYGVPQEGRRTPPLLKISGNAALAGAIYAPSFDFEFKGSGSVGVLLGAAVASTITFTGNAEYHYDVALREYVPAVTTYRVRRWLELVNQADRLDFAAVAARMP